MQTQHRKAGAEIQTPDILVVSRPYTIPLHHRATHAINFCNWILNVVRCRSPTVPTVLLMYLLSYLWLSSFNDLQRYNCVKVMLYFMLEIRFLFTFKRAFFKKMFKCR